MWAIPVGICWGTFLLVWLAGAGYNLHRAPAIRHRPRPHAGQLLLLATVAATLLVVPAADWQVVSFGAAWIRALGLAFLVVGTAFTLWARLTLGAMWTASPALKQAHELRTSGPYAITRHPIYSGALTMLLGTVLVVGRGRLLVLLVFGLVSVAFRVRTEERLLVDAFGDEYQRYRERVPQLIPRPRRSWTRSWTRP
jgi:protein-S-isoprenylcysteine O-methyltransferase Ste14